MDIPIRPADVADLENLFATWKRHLVESVGGQLGGTARVRVSDRSVPGTEAQPGVFGLLGRSSSITFSDPEGTEAEIALEWEGSSCQSLHIEARTGGPEYSALGILAALIVTAGWIVLAGLKAYWILSFRGRALDILVIGGVVAWIVMAVGIGVGVWWICGKLGQMVQEARWRRTRQWVVDTVQPALDAAVADAAQPPSLVTEERVTARRLP